MQSKSTVQRWLFTVAALLHPPEQREPRRLIPPPKEPTSVGRVVGRDDGGDFGRNKPCRCGSGKKYKRCCGLRRRR